MLDPFKIFVCFLFKKVNYILLFYLNINFHYLTTFISSSVSESGDPSPQDSENEEEDDQDDIEDDGDAEAEDVQKYRNIGVLKTSKLLEDRRAYVNSLQTIRRRQFVAGNS